MSIGFCCNKQIKTLYNDINEFDYYEPIIRLSKINIFLNKYIPNKKNKKLKSNNKNDMIMNYYIKTQTDLSIIILFPKTLKQTNKLKLFYDNLYKNGHVHFEKDIELNYLMMYNIIFLLYADENKMNTHNKIINKLEYIGFMYNNFYNIKIIVYKHNNNPIDKSYKNILRNIFLEENQELYDYLHISSTDNQVYEYSNIFFNKNTLNALKKQKFWRLFELTDSITKINKLKDFLYSYSINEIENILIVGSGTLFSYGIRDMNNIDGIMLKNNISIEEIENLNNRYKFEIGYESNCKWIDKANEDSKILGAKDYKELVLNPKYYYYFMGLKFLRLKYSIILRYNKYHVPQITDLLILKQMYSLKYKLYIPDNNLINENELLIKIKKYLNKRYFIDITTEEIKKWITSKKSIKNIEKFIDKSKDKLIKDLSIKSYYIDKDISEEKYVYPSIEELNTLGYNNNIIIYDSYKPYLYPGETYYLNELCKDEKIYKSKSIDNLRIMTYNVHNFITRCNQGINPLYGKGLNPFQKARDIKRFIDFFKDVNADILCLQEVVPILEKDILNDIDDYEYIRNNFNFKYLNKLMYDIGYKYKIISSANKGHDVRYYFLGNAIYSKIKLNNSKIYQISFLDRNIITTQISYKNKIINIVNCHMEYKSKDIFQYNILEEIIKNLDNIILCGDFNINLYDNKSKIKYINDNFNNTNKNIITNFHRNNTTDYILISKKSLIKNIYTHTIKTYLSDHYPIITDFN